MIRKLGAFIRWMRSETGLPSKNFYCPLCEQPVEKFLPLPDFFLNNLQKYGWPYKFEHSEACNVKNYLCPSCGGSDRDRLYALYLRRYFHNNLQETPIKIIDFAPSRPLSRYIQKLIANFSQNIVYRTADLYMEDVDDRVDITNLNIYEDNSFHFFICSHILEHIPDDRQALRELYRILKPGGQGILMVPIVLSIDEIDEDPTITDAGERWRRFGQDDHVRLYAKKGFLERVAEAGFAVQQLGRDFFGEKTFTRYGITLQTVLYVVEKTDREKSL